MGRKGNPIKPLRRAPERSAAYDAVVGAVGVGALLPLAMGGQLVRDVVEGEPRVAQQDLASAAALIGGGMALLAAVAGDRKRGGGLFGSKLFWAGAALAALPPMLMRR